MQNEMFPSPDILNELEYGKFVLSNLAAKRANQLREGATPLVQVDSHHPLTIALAEIAAGKIKPIFQEETTMEEQEGAELLLGDEMLPAELGMLLPSMDEVEVELAEEEETEADEEVEVSLSDLADEEEEEEPAAETEDDTLSLSDIEAQENVEEEEDSES